MTDRTDITRALDRLRPHALGAMTGHQEAAIIGRVRMYLRNGSAAELPQACRLAWTWHDNMTEQAARRLSHDTGATSWA